MTEYEIRQFIFFDEPTAGKVAELTWNNSLADYTLTIEKHHNESSMQYAMMNKYRWEVTFKRVVK
jgi:hypothetical protein